MEKVETKIKSYTERFKEMEEQLMILTEQYFEASQAFTVTADIVKDLSIQIRMLNDQLQAMYDLGVANRNDVENQVNTRRTERIRKILENDEKMGLIKKIDQVLNDGNIVVYEGDDVSLAFKAVAGFSEEGLQSQLIGKKTGDVLNFSVGSEQKFMKIDSIYEIVEQPEQKDSSNGQEK